MVKPKPVEGFYRHLVVSLPVDTPTRELVKILRPKAHRTKLLPGYQLFLLEDRVVIYGAISAPLAVMALETMIASGAKELIHLGWAGSLHPELSVGSAVLVIEALAEEGTSRHYFPRQKVFTSSPALTSRMEKELKFHGLPFFKGMVVSTDAPYRETRAWVSRMKKKGIIAVDMETSAILALASYYQMPAASLLIISDELFHKEWKPHFSSPQLKQASQNYFLPFLR